MSTAAKQKCKCDACEVRLREPITLKPCGHKLCEHHFERFEAKGWRCPVCRKNVVKVKYADGDSERAYEKDDEEEDGAYESSFVSDDDASSGNDSYEAEERPRKMSRKSKN